VKRTACCLAVIVASACGSSEQVVPVPAEPPTAPADLGSEILIEFRTLTSLLTPGLVAYLLVVFFVALAIRRTVGWLVRTLWRFGVDSRRRLARIKGILDLTVMLVAIVLIVRPLFIAVPLVLCIAITVVAFIMAFALPVWIQNFVAGLSLTTRAQFREGDQIEVGDAAGAVDRIGMLRTRLIAADRSRISLPNRDILRLAVRVGREQSAAPVAIELPPELASTPRARREAQRIAQFCPFRRAGSVARLEHRDERWILTIQTWSTRDLAAARLSLEKAIWQLCEPPTKAD
jgi:hypothetical protein